ncbi:hypothetical protein BU15DRAFT_48263 [Melanogaster broomeanus]|nr:hypothetical protein BU15DRAFT_48263 [Melanogaster broomeanus]
MSKLHDDLDNVIKKLAETSLSGLVTPSIISSETVLQHGTTFPISPIKESHLPIANIKVKTANEVMLLAALHEARAANAALKQRLIALQAANILNEMYCSKLRGQLAHFEEKKKKGGKMGKVLGDGLPRLLSGDEFFQRVVEFEEAQEKAAVEKMTRGEERKRHSEALATWKKSEEARKVENNAQRAHYHEALQTWNKEKTRAKTEGRKFGEKRPILGKLAVAVPRPKLAKVTEDVESDGEYIELGDDGASCVSNEED